MSGPYDGSNMDPSLSRSGSVKRARERALAGLPRSPPPPDRQQQLDMDLDEMPAGNLRAPPRRPMAPPITGPLRIPKVRGPVAPDGKDSNLGYAISNPTQVPQWPLPGPPMSSGNQEGEPYRPPPGRPQQAPPRPQRPSEVPSILDQSRLQEPTPVFLTPQTIPDNVRESTQSHDYHSSVPPTPSSRLTTSTIGSIPDFPVPAQTPTPTTAGPNRKSANLGPPPSARRGVSSFYSHASFVSPIPEESAYSRSHLSYASSAAMPESWATVSPAASPTYYQDNNTEKSRDSEYDDFGDESKLVRSASIGKRGKPSLVINRSTIHGADAAQRPAPVPVQPFEGGTGFVEVSTNSSNTLPMSRPAPTPSPNPEQNANPRLTPDAMLGAYAAASATDITEPRLAATPSPRPFNRFSAMRRPPKLDIDAVREAEARGSMTSLPDLIRRATRLATMMDRGRRPGSRFENLGDYLDEKSGMQDRDFYDDRYRSGFSDMLAAFPPPGQPHGDRGSRGSWFRTTSWPLAPGQQGRSLSRFSVRDPEGKPRRRCCGLPMWAFILVVVLLLCIVAAAIVIPLEFFVFKNLGNHDSPRSEMAQCESSLQCQNGGTNVISKGVCSCICTNGFTGSDCSADGTEGCTTTSLSSGDGESNLDNVTLGRAIPRLIADGNGNFSIPLSATNLLAKFNTEDLSCIAQNSLVTFEGQAVRVGEASSKVDGSGESLALNNRDVPVATTTTDPEAHTTITVDLGTQPATSVPTETSSSASSDASMSGTRTAPSSTSDAPAQTTRPTSRRSTPSNAFTVVEEVLDFARVSVLYILQEQGTDQAQDAQAKLQEFFSSADSTSGATKDAASKVQIGGKNSINLVKLTLNIGSGTVGEEKKESKRELTPLAIVESTGRKALHLARHGGSLFSRR